MAQDPNALVWLDMEMTGLDPERDRILELAMVITNGQLEVTAESAVWAVHQPADVLAAMDDWNKKTHGKTGLVERVRASALHEAEVEAQALDFLRRYVPNGKSPMCGNSVCQDRRFMARYMPKLETWFHYRNLDVSTLKELCKRWTPQVAKGVKKSGRHEALADIHESIEELKYYRQHFLKL
jgi:oligoribonuclease